MICLNRWLPGIGVGAVDLELLAQIVAIRMMVEVRDLHHQDGLVMGINFVYNDLMDK